jgi:hypothetical protein
MGILQAHLSSGTQYCLITQTFVWPRSSNSERNIRIANSEWAQEQGLNNKADRCYLVTNFICSVPCLLSSPEVKER